MRRRRRRDEREGEGRGGKRPNGVPFRINSPEWKEEQKGRERGVCCKPTRFSLFSNNEEPQFLLFLTHDSVLNLPNPPYRPASLTSSDAHRQGVSIGRTTERTLNFEFEI